MSVRIRCGKGDGIQQQMIRAKLLDAAGGTVLVTAPVVISVACGVLTDRDVKVVDQVSTASLWPVLGPHTGKVEKEQIAAMKNLVAKNPESILVPGIRCGLAFADEGGQSLEERIRELDALSELQAWGWHMDCQVKKYHLLRGAGRSAEAEAVGRSLTALSRTWVLPIESTKITESHIAPDSK
jgi:hypothetical protein